MAPSIKFTVTHWKWISKLQRDYPEIPVCSDKIFTHNDKIWTSAGLAASIDMCLAMIEEDHGKTLANQVARTMVIFFRRPGEQSQLSFPLELQISDAEGKFERLHKWILQNITRQITVQEMAYVMAMSPRNFARRYKEQMAITPSQMLRRTKFELAVQMLESTNLPISRIADKCGFADVENMRRTFLKQSGACPQQYRDKMPDIEQEQYDFPPAKSA